MAAYTENLNLKKPAQEDFYNVDDFNENFQKMDDFAGRKDNPHGVTKSQVGLDKVDNTSDVEKPVSTAQATAIASAKKAGTDAQNGLNTHIANKSNPHGVTPEQVGAVPELLGNSNDTKINFLFGDHRRLTNHVDATVPNLPIESNYLHMYTSHGSSVDTCLSMPTDYGYDVFYYSAYDKTWRKIADASKFLPLVGGVISGNAVGLNGGYGQVYCDGNNINIFSKNATNKNAGRYLGVYNNKNGLHDSVTMTEIAEDGSHKTYRIYGEHNAALFGIPQVEIVSYVGTGTYGADNPTVISFNRKPTVIIPLGRYGSTSNGGVTWNMFQYVSEPCSILTEHITDSFPTNPNMTTGYSTSLALGAMAKWDDAVNKLSFYNKHSAATQANVAGYEYFYMGITL